MKRFHYDYAMTLELSAPVTRHTFLLHLWPPSDETQRVWGAELETEPRSALPLVRDAFGNLCAAGYIEHPHSRLCLYARGEALVRGGRLEAPCQHFYALPTPLTRADEALAALGDGLRGTAAERALQATERIRARVEYRRGATSETTSAAAAFAQGAGVCQDMAHILLAVLRSCGIPARYVAGLIPGEGETHAWVEVYDGAGFTGVDPTQQRLTDDSYLKISVGRDSRDCAINRGVFFGAAAQRISVSARMDER